MFEDAKVYEMWGRVGPKNPLTSMTGVALALRKAGATPGAPAAGGGHVPTAANMRTEDPFKSQRETETKDPAGPTSGAMLTRRNLAASPAVALAMAAAEARGFPRSV